MSNSPLFVPKSLELVVDPRQLASDFSYAYFLHDVRKGLITEEDETKYHHPTMDDFSLVDARHLVQNVYTWAFGTEGKGLLRRVNFDTTRRMLARAAFLAGDLEGRTIGEIQTARTMLSDHAQSCQEAYNESRVGDYGDLLLHEDMSVSLHAATVLNDLTGEGKREMKNLLMEGFVDDSWAELFQS